MKIFNRKVVLGTFSYTLILRFDVGFIKLEVIDDNNIRNYTTTTCSDIHSVEDLSKFISKYEQIKKIIDKKYTNWIDLDLLDVISIEILLEQMQKVYVQSLSESKMRFLKTYSEPEKRSEDVIKLLEELSKLV